MAPLPHPAPPPPVRRRAEGLGGPGRAWLDGLPQLVREFERRWGLRVGAPLPGGTAALVAAARRTADDTPAVLKLPVPDPDLATPAEAETLRAAAGRGYVRLLDADTGAPPGRRALLLEPLGPPLAAGGLAPEAQLDVLAAVLRDAWQAPRPAGPVPAPDQYKAAALGRLVRELWDKHRRPCPEAVVRTALRCADRRAAAYDPADPRCTVRVHGDPHPGNALRVTRTRPGGEHGYVLVDPDGFRAEPAYDLGVALRDWGPQLLADPAAAPALARRWARRLAERAGADEHAVWEWGYLERVSTGLYALDVGMGTAMAGRFLATADLLR